MKDELVLALRRFTLERLEEIEEEIKVRKIRVRIFERLDKTRDDQDEQWGGPNHDDDHSPEDWADYINKQLSKLQVATQTSGDQSTEIEFRLLQIGALTLAALESMERLS